MATTVTPLPVIPPAPRRTVRDQDEETQARYLARISPPSIAETTATAWAHYSAELASLTRPAPSSAPVDLIALAELLRSAIAATEAYLERDIAVSAIYQAGREDTLAALGLS